MAEAAAAADRLTRRFPERPQGWTLLAGSLSALGHPDAALVAQNQSIALDPTDPAAHANRAAILTQMDQPRAAVEALERAVQLQPDNAPVRVSLGQLLYRLGRREDAEGHLRRAVELLPDRHEVHNDLGNVLNALGRTTEAVECFRRALALAPDYVDALTNLANALKTEGALSEAGERCREALALDPRNVSALYILSTLEKASPDDSRFALLQEALPGASVRDAMDAHFALAKMYDDIEDYERAVLHYTEGHRFRASYHGHAYDPGAVDTKADRIEAVFTRELIEAAAPEGSESRRPIFVVGMPRSGTSLVEQILASHSEVYGAGELNTLSRLCSERFREWSDRLGVGGWESVPHWSRTTRSSVAEEYLARIDGLAQGESRVVDKMPHNFEFVGMISVLFPHATIIHCRRNPVDTCLSNFRQNFEHGHAFTDRLEWIGHHHGYYQRLMAHWTDVVSRPLVEVRYEELVSDPEARIPELLENVGLAFEPACLEFHRTRRAVRTASVTQVRRSMYTTSVERWRRYEPWIGGLLEALG